MADTRDRIDDRAIDRIVDQRAHQRGIDLQVIDRQVTQEHERGHPGAEIVERETAAGRTQFMHALDDAREIGHCTDFGQLQAELSPGQLVAVDQPAHEDPELRVLQAAGRHVHAVPHRLGGTSVIACPQRCQVLRQRIHDPAIDRSEQFIALGSRQEGGWQQQVVIGVEHAHQDFLEIAARQIRAQRRDGLRVEHEAAHLECIADLRDDPRVRGPAAPRFFVRPVYQAAVASFRLRLVAERVGGGDHLRDRAAGRVDRQQADGRADLELASLPDKDEAVHRIAQRRGDAQGLVCRAALEQRTELVPAEPGQYVARAHLRLHRRGELAKQFVPGRVPAAVVDRLEVVEVDVEQRVRLMPPG